MYWMIDPTALVGRSVRKGGAGASFSSPPADMRLSDAAMLSVAVLAVLAASLFSTGEARPGRKGRTPLMGWNTWCTQNRCGVDWCSSAEVLDVAQYIKDSGMLAAGYDVRRPARFMRATCATAPLPRARHPASRRGARALPRAAFQPSSISVAQSLTIVLARLISHL